MPAEHEFHARRRATRSDVLQMEDAPRPLEPERQRPGEMRVVVTSHYKEGAPHSQELRQYVRRTYIAEVPKLIRLRQQAG